ncbi:Stage II sporulation protein R (spore_II_R) [Sulfobacillus thermosulfidooxidans DSM 9293]|uniref:Stage II sporulation protein R (Spore_II_R) n=1 Tax=Sulfobacillus thermosulfidooxidans (strain DSM 9293 / VKM B-1269 / AT-1) TaxID=929705 RepID=A0A1W1WPL0_SULTA|nr:stage II sporulation protein R [Sulfobacillus thermosulfidooxidans]SMC07653.1 Stage II sporulation protein R (spore_II_R) [Sulfobacillus thermosulfidooxidans DSM 9293]
MWIKQILLSLFAMSFLWSLAPQPGQGLVSPNRPAKLSQTSISPPPVIRFRVIANSDNPVDQAVKLDVRDHVLAVLDPLLVHAKTRQQAASILASHIKTITRVADDVLRINHVSYQAHVSLTTTEFPTKAYGSWVLPAGKYQALLVILGKGQGHNWWCVLFPSLCFIDMSNAVAIPVSPASGQAGVEEPESSPTVPESVPALPVRIPHPVPASLRGHIRVSWSLPGFVNHLLGWI